MDEFVPREFDVPRRLETPEFVLEPLGPEHNDQDYDAWTSSVDHIHATPGWEDSSWPHEMTPDENRADLQRHADDFRNRTGFTYTVLDPASRDVIGCVYIYPLPDSDYDARALSWVRATRARLDTTLWRAVTEWLASDWPFGRVEYAPRARTRQRARIASVPEAQLEDFGSGLTPVTQGWFVVNVRDAEWFFAETRGARCAFENEYGNPPVEFAQFGINVTVLEPGQTVLYHAEQNEEAFLVLSGECALLVEGEERRLRPWDFFHSSPWTEHAFVGSGEGPCVILMVGSRSGPGVHYPVSELAARYGASVAEETSDWTQAYATVERFRRARPPSWARLPWA